MFKLTDHRMPANTVGTDDHKLLKKSNLTIDLKYPTDISKANFIKYRNKFKQIRISAEQQYYADKFAWYKHYVHMTWNIAQSLVKAGDQNYLLSSLL